LLLREEEPLIGALNIDAQEVMNTTKITHGEFVVKGVNDGVKERRGVGCEYYVINIQEKICHGGASVKNE
jgi:hypothetical protein